METRKWLHMIAFVLVIIGGVNWGLFGLIPTANGGLDLIDVLFRFSPTLQEIIYVLIGVSAVYLAITHTKDCKVCAAK
jgi:uncharacterized membrane protein YuzA (DUF378 family)